MKKIKLLSTLSFLLIFGGSLLSQPIFWSDTFDAPAGGANNNNAGAGWNLNPAAVGTNIWFINNSNTNCQGANMLHISCSGGEPLFPPLPLTVCDLASGPENAAYNADEASVNFAISPNINTTGQTGITLRFFWTCNGDFNNDFGTISFSNDGGATWTEQPTFYQGIPQGQCVEEVIALPAIYENIPNFQIRFRWINNGDNVGVDHPFNIDDIRITADAATSETITTGSVLTGPYCPGQEVIVPFTVSGTFNPGNVFTAQLSNAAGTFTAPVNIGTLN